MPIAGKPIETFWDLGKRDHTSIWFAQLQFGEYRILDFYQGRGYFLDHYVNVLKERGYTYGNIYLPHDANSEKLNAKSIANDLRALMPSHTVIVRPRMENKAMGISAVRKIFPNCYFDEQKCEEGLDALGAFKFKVDQETNGYSKEPLHDENSDAADAFAQLALSLQEPKVHKAAPLPNNRRIG
jgi:phage terminase large subunit